MTEKLFSKVDQIGVVVRDMDKAVEYYQSLGIGPFEPLPKSDAVERKYFGKPIDPTSVKLKIQVAQMGPVQLELIQPIEGDSVFMDFLKTKGEGINHLAFWVDDIDKEEARLVEKGLPLLYRSRFRKGGGAAHFDTRKIGGFFIELIQWAPE